MEQRFENYLNKFFNSMPMSIEVLDFKEELLGNLIDKAEECRGKGMSDDQVYKFCIDNLGDFSDTLRKLNRNPKIRLTDSKTQKGIILTLASILALVTVNLLFCLLTNDFSNWYITSVGSAIVICVVLSGGIYKCLVLKSYVWAVVLIEIFLFVLHLTIYFLISVLTGTWGLTWIIFILMLPMALGFEMFFRAMVIKKKIGIFSIVTEIMLIALALFFILSNIGLGYGKTWIVFLIAIVLNLLIIGITHGKKRHS